MTLQSCRSFLAYSSSDRLNCLGQKNDHSLADVADALVYFTSRLKISSPLNDKVPDLPIMSLCKLHCQLRTHSVL